MSLPRLGVSSCALVLCCLAHCLAEEPVGVRNPPGDATIDRVGVIGTPMRWEMAEDGRSAVKSQQAPSLGITRATGQAPEQAADRKPIIRNDFFVAAQSPDEYEMPSLGPPLSNPARAMSNESISSSLDTPLEYRPARTVSSDSSSYRTCRPSPFDAASDAFERANVDRSWDNLYFFFIGESFRLTDEGTRLAARVGMNWGLPVIDNDRGLGVQFGFSGSWAEEAPQWFLTGGLFYRGDMRCDWAWNVGGAFDFVQDDELHADVGQVRGKTSFTLDRKNEIGVWGAISVLTDDNGPYRVESMDQVNGFYRYLFDTGTELTGWGGWRREPSSLALGISTYTPISDRWAGIFGMYYAFHGDNWNVYSGLVWHWCDRATVEYLGQDRHQPYFPVADNTSMTLFKK